MENILPTGSSWLFTEPDRRESMAGGFETLVLDHAKLVDRALTRTVTGPSTRHRDSRNDGKAKEC